MPRKRYPSDVTREQFNLIAPLLDGARKKTRPRDIDLYEAFCGVLYILKSGASWRMLPEGFPTWQSTYAYWRIWSTENELGVSLLQEVLKKIGWKGEKEPWSKREHYLSDY